MTMQITTTQAMFRNGMSRLAAAVHIVTTDGAAGRFGFTASAICSVTDAPPTLLVCVNRKSSAIDALMENGALCVNTLSPAQQPLSRVFGGGTPMAERFSAASWHMTASGTPRLAGALVSFDCRIATVADEGTHRILFCRVLGIVENEAAGALVYFGRSYHGIADAGTAMLA